jgi:Protein of unknown function (DUF2934)
MSNPGTASPSRSAGRSKLTKPPAIGQAAAARAALPAEQRHTMIAIAAYYISERRGFEAGHELEDWLLAESEIDRAPRDGAAARS